MEKDFSFDKSNLRDVILSYPNELEQGRLLVDDISIPEKEYSNLIVSGMGGSSLPFDLLIGQLSHEKKLFNLPIYIARSYFLPHNANADSLIFISSYSGNTEETVSCFEQALQTGATIVAFSAGGKVEQMAKENDCFHVNTKIDQPNFQPRYALTYVLAAMHSVLAKATLCEKIENFPKISPEDFESQGEQLAKKLVGKTPVVYASDMFRVLAKVLKIKFNENAKTPAFWNYYPELSHNEMVGFTNPQSDFFVIMITDEADHTQVQKRVRVTAELYKQKGVESEIINPPGENYLEKVLNGMVLGDWISYYLAKEYGQDPTPVDMVEDLKKMLK